MSNQASRSLDLPAGRIKILPRPAIDMVFLHYRCAECLMICGPLVRLNGKHYCFTHAKPIIAEMTIAELKVAILQNDHSGKDYLIKALIDCLRRC